MTDRCCWSCVPGRNGQFPPGNSGRCSGPSGTPGGVGPGLVPQAVGVQTGVRAELMDDRSGPALAVTMKLHQKHWSATDLFGPLIIVGPYRKLSALLTIVADKAQINQFRRFHIIVQINLNQNLDHPPITEKQEINERKSHTEELGEENQ